MPQHRPPVLLAAFITALAIACGDFLIAFGRAPESWPTLDEVLPSVAALALPVFGGSLLVWHGLVRRLARRRGIADRGLAEATGLFLCASWLLLAAEGLLGSDLFRTGSLLRAAVTLVAAWFVAQRVYGALNRPATTGWLVRRGGGLVRALPPLLVLAVLAVWRFATPAEAGPERSGALFWAAAAVLIPAAAVGWRAESKGLVVAGGAFLAVLGAAGVAFLVRDGFLPTGVRPAEAAPAKVKHVILISADSLRADALSVYRAGANATPHLERLAADSLVFRHAYSSASWTLPSVTSLLTGLPTYGHGVFWMTERLADEIPTLADLMSGAGYRTAAVTDNPVLDPRLNLYKGFEEYLHYPRPWPWTGDSAGRRLLAWMAPARFHRGGTEEVTRAARAWLERHRNEPIFLWVHYLDPHVPYSPPERFLPAGPAPPSIGSSFDQHVAVLNGTRLLSSEERDWVRELYLAEVRYLDEQIGVLVDTLKRLGLYENALIIFTSDHGEEFWEHGAYQHGHSLFEEVVAVPLLVKLPGARQTGEVRPRVSVEFVLPTIADVCGLPRRDACYRAPSLAALARQETLEAHSGPLLQAGTCYQEELEAVIFDGRFKLIRRLGTQREELFDLGSDPGERRCLLASAPAAAEEGRRALEEVRERLRLVRSCYQVRERQAPAAGKERLRQLRSLGYLN